mgnify:CR=1 FL=1
MDIYTQTLFAKLFIFCLSLVVLYKSRGSVLGFGFIGFSIFLLWTLGTPRQFELYEAYRMLQLDGAAAVGLSLLTGYFIYVKGKVIPKVS